MAPSEPSQAQKVLGLLQAESANRPASYSAEIYMDQLRYMRPPPFTTNLLALEESAKARLPPESYAYAAGGASTEATMRANREAFDLFRILTRMLRTV